jgi:hypothetical protein
MFNVIGIATFEESIKNETSFSYPETLYNCNCIDTTKGHRVIEESMDGSKFLLCLVEYSHGKDVRILSIGPKYVKSFVKF